ncbi:hypothetical protein D3C86_770350 [compost metagenome]
MTNATSVMAQGIMRGEVWRRIALARRSVVPESARILPSMAPSAMTTPTAPSVLPAPSVRFFTMAVGAMPVAKPTPIDTINSASSGCMRMRETMRATSTKTLTRAVSSN